jgi:hypothetical protein
MTPTKPSLETCAKTPRPINALRTRVVRTPAGWFQPQSSNDSINWTSAGIKMKTEAIAIQVAQELQKVTLLTPEIGEVIWKSE